MMPSFFSFLFHFLVRTMSGNKLHNCQVLCRDSPLIKQEKIKWQGNINYFPLHITRKWRFLKSELCRTQLEAHAHPTTHSKHTSFYLQMTQGSCVWYVPPLPPPPPLPVWPCWHDLWVTFTSSHKEPLWGNSVSRSRFTQVQCGCSFVIHFL